MLHFHFCQSYIDQVTPKVDEVIRRKIADFEVRADIIGINNIIFFGHGLYILKTSTPTNVETVIQKDKVDWKGQVQTVFFIQSIISTKRVVYVRNQLKTGIWAIQHPITKSDKMQFVTNFEAQKVSKQKELTPEYLTNWHDEYEIEVKSNVYETENWVKYAKSNTKDDGMQLEDVKLFQITLKDILENQPIEKEIIKKSNNTITYIKQKNKVGIIYSQIWLSKAKQALFLLHHGAHIKNQKEYWERSQQEIKQKEQKYTTVDDVSRVAFRSYPEWIVTGNNDQLWKHIQKQSIESNLSLLSEQTTFLRNFMFPAYINGQAGSGKSTMLYYLFANAYYYKCLRIIEGDLIFLTENEQLLKQSKSKIIELLQYNPEFELDEVYIEKIDQCFWTFKQYLLFLLKEEYHPFVPHLYLNFSKFKLLYEQSNEPTHYKEKYPAELVWFAISTYIYGHDLDYIINSENYEERMPRESKDLLPKTILRGIEQKALPFYNRLLSKGYWDKIKIIKHIRNKSIFTKKYTVLFCDEAQDFSRIELRFMLQLSEYLQYDLSQTKQLPIIFAGDALQTVNPTGFRSKEIKTMLYEELHKGGQFKWHSNRIEYAPQFNYRSSHSIVNVANAIQYFRQKYLHAKVPNPQKAKYPQPIDYHLNIFVDFNVLVDNEELKEKLKYKTIIIPTTVDEKNSFFHQHPFLDNFTYTKSDGEKLSTIKTAVETKGLDYPQVVLYGFGSYCIEKHGNYNDLIHDDRHSTYEKRFFFNKLYVAVTRAQFELVIIDSEVSKAQFWIPLIQHYATADWSRESEVPEEVIQDTICFEANKIRDIQPSTRDIALDNAQKDKEQGVWDNNPALLRLAAAQFIRLGDKKEYYICFALKNKIEGNWEKAAEYYLKKEVGIKRLDYAADVYWQGQLLKEFLTVGEKVRGKVYQLRLFIATLMTFSSLDHQTVERLYQERALLRNIVKEITWRDEVIKQFTTWLKKDQDTDLWKNMVVVLTEIADQTDRTLWRFIAHMNYTLERYEKAIDIWNKIENNEHLNDVNIDYIQAQRKVAEQQSNDGAYIMWTGKWGDLVHQKEQKKEARQLILKTYASLQKAIDDSDDIKAMTRFYIYSAMLIEVPNHLDLLSIAQQTEQTFKNQPLILVNYYTKLLQKRSLTKPIISFVLHRWAKYSWLHKPTISSINQAYKQFTTQLSIPYHPFTEQDISEISVLPKVIFPAFPKHIETITIKGFRAFKNVTIENLGQFNLIVGDNNIGKTSLLEAFLFVPDAKTYLLRLAFAHIERRNIHPDKQVHSRGQELFYNLIPSFLDEFKHYDQKEWQLVFLFEEKRHVWQYKVGRTKKSVDDIGAFQYTNVQKPALETLNHIPFLDRLQQPFIPYGKGFDVDLPQVYLDEIGHNKQREAAFLKAMQVFIPNVERIMPDTKNGLIFIRSHMISDEDRPLHEYGDGANKLFRILLMLSIHKGKKVLIDEIDAGIHYSRFKEFWRIILTVAEKDNTQIMATTHNEECIQYFAEVLEETQQLQDKARVLQCKKVNKKVKIRSYDFDNFTMALEDGAELRGGNRR